MNASLIKGWLILELGKANTIYPLIATVLLVCKTGPVFNL